MDGKKIRCLQIVSQHVPIYLQQFPSYWNRKCQKSPFSRTAAHIFVSPGDALRLSRNMLHGWIDNSMLAKPLAVYVPYLSIFNSFRVIRCLSQCVSPKIAIFTTFFVSPGDVPAAWGNHAKCCMDGKRIRCLQIVSLHVPIYLQQFPSYSNRKCKKSPFSRTAARIFVSPGDAPATIT